VLYKNIEEIYKVKVIIKKKTVFSQVYKDVQNFNSKLIHIMFL